MQSQGGGTGSNPVGGGTHMDPRQSQGIQRVQPSPTVPPLARSLNRRLRHQGWFLVFWVVSVVVSVGGVLGGVLFVLMCRGGVKCLWFV